MSTTKVFGTTLVGLVNPHADIVQGYTYCATMSNGAVFTFWTSTKLSRLYAIDAGLWIANDGSGDIYARDDIISCRLVK